MSNGADVNMSGTREVKAEEEEEELIEDPEDDEGAIYPLKGISIMLGALLQWLTKRRGSNR